MQGIEWIEMGNSRHHKMVKIMAKNNGGLAIHKFRNHLSAGTAGTDRILCVRGCDRKGAKCLFSKRYRSIDGTALGAIRQSKRPVLHIDTGYHRTVFQQEGRTDTKTGIRRIGVIRDIKGHEVQVPVLYCNFHGPIIPLEVMNIKGNLRIIIVASSLFLIIYLFIAPLPLGKEIYFVPEWTLSVSHEIEFSGQPEGQRIPFTNGSAYGYLAPEGNPIRIDHTGKRISITENSWTIYDQDQQETVVYNPDGSEKLIVRAAGFVHLSGNRTFLFLPGGGAVSEYGDDGTVLWTRDHTAPITTFETSEAGTVIGYADGKLTAINRGGTDILSVYPGGSSIPVILGASLTNNGEYVLCVAGIQEQRVVLFRIRNGQSKVVYHTFLSGSLRRQVHTSFDETGSWAFFDSTEGLGIIDIQNLTVSQIPVNGALLSAGKHVGNGLFIFLAAQDDNHELLFVERPNHVIARVPFRAENAFLVQNNHDIYLGTDSVISKIGIRGIE